MQAIIHECPFYKFSPAGNITLLVPRTALPEELRTAAAQTFVLPTHIYAEQVGYYDADARRLDMAGGEFCVNATRAFAALLAMQNGNAPLDCTVSVSGMPEPVSVSVRGEGPLREVTARLSLEGLPECRRRDRGVLEVCVPGITHLLIDERAVPFSEAWKEKSAGIRSEYLPQTTSGAVGCIWWRRTENGVAIRPVVWVAGQNSTFLESACGSGTLACVCGIDELRETAMRETVEILQPSGGILGLRLQKKNTMFFADISGTVSLVAKGTTFVEAAS